MVGESNRNVFFIQIDASSFAEFETSEFEISSVDCSFVYVLHEPEVCYKTVDISRVDRPQRPHLVCIDHSNIRVV